MTRPRAKMFADRGFTMIEMIVVIVITGIIAGAVAVFIRLPVQGYVDAARRAEMTDIADSALRRMERDLRLALPNSIRITPDGKTLEFLLTRTGGRYRVTNNGAGTGDFLDFSQPDISFDQFGQFATGVGQAIVANSDRLVIYNLGISGADAYAGDNTSLITSTAAGDLTYEYKINFLSKQFLFESPGARFQVIEGPVTYAWDSTTRKMTRYSGYQIFPAQQTAAVLAGSATSQALVASNVENCIFDYTPGVTARSAVMALTLKITESGESAQLYHEVHVSNVP
jgi:MSHA biogenesis protein MshO